MSSFKTAFTARSNIRERSAMFQIVLDKLYFMDQKSNLCAFARFYGYLPLKFNNYAKLDTMKHDLRLNLKPIYDQLWPKAILKSSTSQNNQSGMCII